MKKFFVWLLIVLCANSCATMKDLGTTIQNNTTINDGRSSGPQLQFDYQTIKSVVNFIRLKLTCCKQDQKSARQSVKETSK